MADEPQMQQNTVLQAINWREVFPFTHIFRAFRVAVHPSKLVLGLVALLTLYIGGRILDAIWPTASKANYHEVWSYQEFAKKRDPSANFAEKIKADRKANRDAMAARLQEKPLELITAAQAQDEATDIFGRAGEVKGKFQALKVDALKKAEEQKKKDIDEANKETDSAKKEKALKKIEEDHKALRPKLDQDVAQSVQQMKALLPHGVFDQFFEYQISQVNVVARGVFNNNWLVAGGVVDGVTNFFSVGPRWLWGYHTVYAILFTILFLGVWAVFGGAISRIAAVHIAREEKISVRQALRFSVSKILSFVFAPLIPVLILAAIGLVVAVGGLLYYLPVGDIVASALFILALLAGIVATLVLFGTVGGLGLMFPTIAVEGSDSFDAISRSFSYVFARPWRMLFYTAVAVGYGALSYLFVRFFVWLTLVLTHSFVTAFLTGDTAYGFNAVWPEPLPFAADKLPYDVNYAGLSWSESPSSFLISFWVYLLIGMVGAFAISFYFSSSTIIYYLMRREVDATELEDVYVEDADDDLMDTAPVAPLAVPSQTSTPATIVGTIPQ